VIKFIATSKVRKCGDCQLCCKLLPVGEIGKPANTRCEHQAHGKGCRVYGTDTMPMSCKLWSCAWLTGHDTGARPDRAHYVVDVLPDYISIQNDETGERIDVPVIQVWVDPKHPDAHRDPALRAFLAERGEHGVAAIIRYSSQDAFTLFPPAMASDGEWHEERSRSKPERQHTAREIRAALAGKFKAG